MQTYVECVADFKGDPPWGEDGTLPTFNICGCCGVEFGCGDFTLKAIHSRRKTWLIQSAKWEDKEEKPNDWDLEEQMKNIPLEF